MSLKAVPSGSPSRATRERGQPARAPVARREAVRARAPTSGALTDVSAPRLPHATPSTGRPRRRRRAAPRARCRRRPSRASTSQSPGSTRSATRRSWPVDGDLRHRPPCSLGPRAATASSALSICAVGWTTTPTRPPPSRQCSPPRRNLPAARRSPRASAHRARSATADARAARPGCRHRDHDRSVGGRDADGHGPRLRRGRRAHRDRGRARHRPRPGRARARRGERGVLGERRRAAHAGRDVGLPARVLGASPARRCAG